MKTLRFYSLCFIGVGVCLLIFFTVTNIDFNSPSAQILKFIGRPRKDKLATLESSSKLKLPFFEKGYLVKTLGCKILDEDPGLKEKMSVIQSQRNPSQINQFHKYTVSYVLNSQIHLNSSEMKILAKKKKFDILKISCCFRPVYRGLGKRSDLYARVDEICVPFKTGAIIKHEIVRVECSVNKSIVYKHTHAFIRKKSKVEKRCKKAARKLALHDDHLSVLIVGIEGISRQNFHRSMEKSKKAMLNQSAIEFVGYNSVGENTYPNLIPLLTGLSSQQFQSAACRKKNKVTLDGCPFIWNMFSSEGFRTAYVEDSADHNLFISRGGFVKPPTDYYFYPLYLLNKFGTYGKQHFRGWEFTEARQTLNLLSRLVQTFKSNKYFVFAWLNSLTHGNMMNAPSLDDVLHPFFQDLFSTKVLNNTVLVFMSDHGQRYGKYRQTAYGWAEAKLPLLYLLFPKWFFDKYPNLNQNLLSASRQLTTAYDLHGTLKDILFHEQYRLHPGAHVDEYEEIVSAKGVPNRMMLYKTKRKGASFFQVLPENRTCADARIPESFCSCYAVNQISFFSDFIPSAIKALVNKTNDRTKSYRSLCSKLVLEKLIDVRVMVPNDSSDDYNVLVSKEKRRSTLKYLLVFRVGPGSLVFEGIVELLSSNKPKVLDILRVNKIDTESTLCVKKPNLKLYCHCRKKES